MGPISFLRVDIGLVGLGGGRWAGNLNWPQSWFSSLSLSDMTFDNALFAISTVSHFIS